MMAIALETALLTHHNRVSSLATPSRPLAAQPRLIPRDSVAPPRGSAAPPRGSAASHPSAWVPCRCTKSALRSFGSIHVLFGGKEPPASAMALIWEVGTGCSSK